MAQFEQALKRLVEDSKYRESVIKEPNRIIRDFKLDAQEILLLMQVWHATGDPRALPGGIDLCHCCCGSSEAEAG
jgi:hypothetical protein